MSKYFGSTSNQPQNKAVIYCRVSSTAQTKRGDGLNSQETRCREFAQARGYQVARVFTDDMSGSTVDRPGMKALLAFLKRQKQQSVAVLIDDISRLARGISAHTHLRAAIASAGGRLERPPLSSVTTPTVSYKNTSWPRFHSTKGAKTRNKPSTGCARGS